MVSNLQTARLHIRGIVLYRTEKPVKILQFKVSLGSQISLRLKLETRRINHAIHITYHHVCVIISLCIVYTLTTTHKET